MSRLAVVDLEIGNLQSVLNALKTVGAETTIVSRKADLDGAKAILLPGVGAYGDGAKALRDKDLVDVLRDHALKRKTPIFGICLGMQLLSTIGKEHGDHRGLDIIPGEVIALEPTKPGYRVPNMGWCDLEISPKSRLFSGIANGEPVYFANSFHFKLKDPGAAAARFEYSGAWLTAGIEQGNVFGAQFHPEKSQNAGLTLLSNFVKVANQW